MQRHHALSAADHPANAGGVTASEPWGTVAATLLCHVVVYGVVYTFGTVSSQFQQHLQIGAGESALLFSVTLFVFQVCTPVVGRVAVHLGPRMTVVLGGSALMLGLIVVTLPVHRLLAAASYCVGVGGAMSAISAPLYGLIVTTFQMRRGLALGIAISGIGVGTLLVVPAAAFAVLEVGWALSYRVLGVFGGLLMMLAAVGLPGRGALPVQANAGLVTSFADPRFRVLYAGTLLTSIAMFLPFAFAPAVARATAGVDQTQAAFLITAMGTSGVVSRLVTAGAAGHQGALRLSMACLGVALASLFIWLNATHYWMHVVFAVLWGAGYAGQASLFPLVVAEAFGAAHTPRLLANLYTASACGALVGAPLGSLLIERASGYGAMITLAVGCYALTCALQIILMRGLRGHEQ